MWRRGRSAIATAAWILASVLQASCTPEEAHLTVRAEFRSTVAPDGTIVFVLAMPAETWKAIGHGERLDGQHQNISARTIEEVSDLIDADLEGEHLCPRAWTMKDIRHFDNGALTFSGSCDKPAGERT